MKKYLKEISIIIIIAVFIAGIAIANKAGSTDAVLASTETTSIESLSNKKIGWGIKRSDNHEQPDVGTKNKEILDKYNLLEIDVLKVGHHGSKTSSGKEFINEINPKYSIISVGKNNRYGHPNKEVLNNLEKSKIYRTDMDGSIMFKIKNYDLKIETCVP